MSISFSMVKSLACSNGIIHTTEELWRWIEEINKNTFVMVEESNLENDDMWFYDDYNGEISNRKRSFFSISGMRYFINGEFVEEQPIIFQPEIGYLGIICKEIEGVIHFLMQAKIEPGNVNCVQISPTIQATKSNFTRVHGGKLPPYFDYFDNCNSYNVIYDQIQPEQTTRFYKKRNRNIIILVDDNVKELPNFRWMTLGQIKEFLKIDNLVNMDTRTVISGIPFVSFSLKEDELKEIRKLINDDPLFKSIFEADPQKYLPQIFGYINKYKMYNDNISIKIPLSQLVDWEIGPIGLTCRKPADFNVRFYNIEIHGREIKNWSQPLFCAKGNATYGLLTREKNGILQILVRIVSSIGCYDCVEIGPTIQWEASHDVVLDNIVDKYFRKAMCDKERTVRDVVLSEEGGRFYHEQNRNIIIRFDDCLFEELPEGYVWVDYGTLNLLIYSSGCLSIQLRNLLTLEL